jgi:hypothetical protein
LLLVLIGSHFLPFKYLRASGGAYMKWTAFGCCCGIGADTFGAGSAFGAG